MSALNGILPSYQACGVCFPEFSNAHVFLSKEPCPFGAREALAFRGSILHHPSGEELERRKPESSKDAAVPARLCPNAFGVGRAFCV